MTEPTTEPLSFPSPPEDSPEVFADASRVPDDPLTACLRDGARKMLIQAVEAEVAQWVDERSHLRDADGRQQVVRNGYADERTVVTGLGPMQVKMPRAHDRRPASGGRERFTSKLLPPYLRKAKAIDELIPWLYLNRRREEGTDRGPRRPPRERTVLDVDALGPQKPRLDR